MSIFDFGGLEELIFQHFYCSERDGKTHRLMILTIWICGFDIYRIRESLSYYSWRRRRKKKQDVVCLVQVLSVWLNRLLAGEFIVICYRWFTLEKIKSEMPERPCETCCFYLPWQKTLKWRTQCFHSLFCRSSYSHTVHSIHPFIHSSIYLIEFELNFTFDSLTLKMKVIVPTILVPMVLIDKMHTCIYL